MTSNSVPSLREIARLAGVSPSTVSRVLRDRPGVSESTKQRVYDAISQAGSSVAEVRLSSWQRFQSSHTTDEKQLLALVVPHVGSAFYVEVLKGVEAEAYRRGYGLTLFTTAGRGHDNVVNRVLASGYCQGIILITPRHEETTVLATLEADSLPPVVVVDHRSEGNPFPHIMVDNITGAMQATRYLLENGHRRIGFITGDMSIPSAVDRLRGYRLALEEAGVPFDQGLVVEGSFEQQTGRAAIEYWLAAGKSLPDAWFCSNDLMAIGAMQALHSAGVRVPDDVAVMGYDDLPVAQAVSPTLTTVAQPMTDMGAMAVRMIGSMLEQGGEGVPRVVLDTSLVKRESA